MRVLSRGSSGGIVLQPASKRGKLAPPTEEETGKVNGNKEPKPWCL